MLLYVLNICFHWDCPSWRDDAIISNDSIFNAEE